MQEQFNCIACKKPAKYMVMQCPTNDIKVSFCEEHIQGCLTCGKCEIKDIN